MMAPADDPEATASPLRHDGWVPAFPDLEPAIRRASEDGRYDPYETGKLTNWSVGRVAVVGDSAHAMVPSLGQGAGMAMMNALSLAVAVDGAPSIEHALVGWEARERPMTEFTQDCSAEVARARINAGGRMWSENSLRPARTIPTGTEHLPRLLN